MDFLLPTSTGDRRSSSNHQGVGFFHLHQKYPTWSRTSWGQEDAAAGRKPEAHPSRQQRSTPQPGCQSQIEA